MGEGRLGVVACDVVKGELERVIGGRGDVELKFMDYALHATPKEMPGKLNDAVEEMRGRGCSRVALAYGLCSNGTAGVKAGCPLVMPRCHDCISMLLGSPARYMEVFTKLPGTYFLSDGWLRNGADPIATVETRYAPKMGEKRAWKGMAMEIANYKYCCLINNGVGDVKLLRERAMANCKAFNKEYIELDADLSYFEALLDGPHDPSGFLVMQPGEAIQDHQFYQPPNPVVREVKTAAVL
jgi:hypothetical protein